MRAPIATIDTDSTGKTEPRRSPLRDAGTTSSGGSTPLQPVRHSTPPILVRVKLRLLLAVALIVSACATATDGPVPTPTTPPTSDLTTAPTTAPASPPCLGGDVPFATQGMVAAFGEDHGDAAAIAGLRWANHPGCERVVIDLLTANGAPAGSTGPVAVDYTPGLGIIRVLLAPAVATTAVADSRFDGDLAARAYVVRTRDEQLAVDIHVPVGATVGVRSFAVAEPARIVIDLINDPEGVTAGGATVGKDVVVTEPSPGTATYPLVVRGYARTFEANVLARLTAVAGDVAPIEATATATDWLDAWGEFELTIDEGPRTIVNLFVGEESANDGSLIGVNITLDLSDPGEPNPADR